MTGLFMIGILMFGIMSYRLLPVAALPNVDFPTIQVQAALPGASPETMASAVATPLEKQFSTIAGVDSMTSTSAQGTTQITLQFSLDRNLDAAAQDVQSAIAAAQRFLPPEMPAPPNYRKVNPAEQAILYLALSSPILPLSTVDEYAETLMGQRISMINGVAQVLVFGSQKFGVRIQLNPNSLASRGIGIDEVGEAVRLGNANVPTGMLSGEHQAFTVQATGQLNNAADYRRLIVAYRNGSPVRLEELGRVIDGVQNDKVASWYNDTRAVVLAIQRQPGTNTIEVVDAVKRLLPVFRLAPVGAVAVLALALLGPVTGIGPFRQVPSIGSMATWQRFQETADNDPVDPYHGLGFLRYVTAPPPSAPPSGELAVVDPGDHLITRSQPATGRTQ